MLQIHDETVPPFTSLGALKSAVLQKTAQGKGCKFVLFASFQHEKCGVHHVQVAPLRFITIEELMSVVLYFKTDLRFGYKIIQLLSQHFV